jgi:hypothetical protein
MNDGHDALRELVLGYEELDAESRATADAHLASCPACRALLARVQQVERRAQSLSPPAGFDAANDDALGAADREAADRSLVALRAKLGLPSSTPAPAAAPRPARWSWRAISGGRRERPRTPTWVHVLAPVAAIVLVVAMIALWPRPAAPPTAVHGLEIAPWSRVRAPRPQAWRTGDAFVLRFRLDRPAHVVVFHVGPDGRPALLHPADPRAEASRFPAGEVQLPDSAGGIEWRFEGDPGLETFLVATTESRDLAMGEIVEAARRLGEAGRPRAAITRELAGLLEDRVGPVRTIEVEHAP